MKRSPWKKARQSPAVHLAGLKGAILISLIMWLIIIVLGYALGVLDYAP